MTVIITIKTEVKEMLQARIFSLIYRAASKAAVVFFYVVMENLNGLTGRFVRNSDLEQSSVNARFGDVRKLIDAHRRTNESGNRIESAPLSWNRGQSSGGLKFCFHRNCGYLGGKRIAA